MSQIKEELQKKIIEELQKNPITSYACKQVGVARSTLYRWLEEDYVFKEAYNKASRLGKGAILDFAKLKLFKLMNSNDERVALETTKYYIDRFDPAVSKRRRTFNEIKMKLDMAQRNQAEKEIKEIREMMDYVKRHTGDLVYANQDNFDEQKQLQGMAEIKKGMAEEKRITLQGIEDEKKAKEL